jgi:uncharacterized protein YggT (Ycf19 family)
MYREVRRTTVPEREGELVTVRGGAALTAARIVSLIGGIIVAILGLRFLLSLLGANPTNAFANVIYRLSRPFVAPFYGLFNYHPQFGVVRFEWETLIAMLFWSFVTWMVVRLLRIGDRAVDDV